MTITEISLVSIAGSLIILVLGCIGVFIYIQRCASLIKRDVHSLTVKGKATIHSIKDLAAGSLNLIAQRKRSKKNEKVLNWVAIGMSLYQLASKYFGKRRRKR